MHEPNAVEPLCSRHLETSILIRGVVSSINVDNISHIQGSWGEGSLNRGVQGVNVLISGGG